MTSDRDLGPDFAVVICARCDLSIPAGEDYEEMPKLSASGAGTTLHLHVGECPPLPR